MKKIKFSWALLRLKEALGIEEEQDIAALLGMSKAAFSARKARDSFPEDKLLALVAKRPDLNIDVAYVLTGDPAQVHAVMSNLRAATDIADSMGGSRDEKAARQDAMMEAMRREKNGLTAEQERAGYSVEVLSPEEQALLDNYRHTPAETRGHIREVGAALAKPGAGKKRAG